MMTSQEFNKRRALIVRRWAAYRASCTQREIWKKRRARAGSPNDDETIEVVGDADLLAELPDGLVG